MANNYCPCCQASITAANPETEDGCFDCDQENRLLRTLRPWSTPTFKIRNHHETAKKNS